MGLARQNPDGSTDQLEFYFEGTDADGSVLRFGSAGQELSPILAFTPLAVGPSLTTTTPSIDLDSGTLRVPRTMLDDPHGLYIRNAMLLREYAVRLRNSDDPLGEVEYIVVSATYDAASDQFVLVLDPRGLALQNDVAQLADGTTELQVEVVPFYFRLVANDLVDAYPQGTDIKILFDATIEDPSTGEPSANAEAAYSARVDLTAMDLNVKNGFAGEIAALNEMVASPGQTDPGNIALESVQWDFVRYKVQFDIGVGGGALDPNALRPGIDFLRMAFRF